MLQNHAISEHLKFKIFLGEHTPRPPTSYARKTRIVMSITIESWPDHPNFAGSGPVMVKIQQAGNHHFNLASYLSYLLVWMALYN